MLCLWVGVGAALLRILVVIRSLWQGVTLTQVGQGWMCGDLHGSFRPPVTPLGDFVSDDTGQHRGGCGSAGDFCSRSFEAPGSIPSISKTKPGNPFSVPAGLSVRPVFATFQGETKAQGDDAASLGLFLSWKVGLTAASEGWIPGELGPQGEGQGL